MTSRDALKMPAQVAALLLDMIERGGTMPANLEAWRYSDRAWTSAQLAGWVRCVMREAVVGGVRIEAKDHYELTPEGRDQAERVRAGPVRVEDLEAWAKKFHEARARARGGNA